jgi:hypothetical protein
MTASAPEKRPRFLGYNARTQTEVERLDLTAHYTGTSRANFMRMAVAFLDSTITLQELARIEASEGSLTEAQAKVREEATQTMEDVLTRLRPQPIVPMALN